MLSDGLALTIWDLSSSPQSYTWCKTTKNHLGKQGFPGMSYRTLMLSKCSFSWRTSKAGNFAEMQEDGWV